MRHRPNLRRIGLFLAAAAVIPACGGGGGGGFGPSGPLSGDGGNVFANFDAWLGTGGTGGTVDINSEGDIRVAVDAAPTAPALTAPPTSGTDVTTGDLTGTFYTQAVGNILITTAAVTAVAATYTVTATAGDIVISGSLQSGDVAGAPADLVLNAPAGTVYITGSVRTSNTDGFDDGDWGGNLTINALAVVFRGTVVTSGENGVGLGTSGGDAGAVSVTVTGGATSDIYFVGGSVTARGGNGDFADGDGGWGGVITLIGQDASSDVGIHGTRIDTTGGASATGGVTPRAGGAGGSVVIEAPGTVEVKGTLTLIGGVGRLRSGASTNAFGGVGGSLSINFGIGSTGPVALFGTVTRTGGGAFGGSASGTEDIFGGNGGDLTIGESSPGGAPSSVSMGAAPSARGGFGRGIAWNASGSGGGGIVVLRNDYGTGDIELRFPIDVSGGDGEIGGVGGGITLQTTVGNIDVPAVLTAFGGNSTFGPAGLGGSVDIVLGNNVVAASGTLFLTGRVDVSGGHALEVLDTPGDGGVVTITADDSTVGASVSSVIDIDATVLLDGGSCQDLASGGAGGVLSITSQGPVTLAGLISAVGGRTPSADPFDVGGDGGFVDVLTDPSGGGAGNGAAITLVGSINVSGGRGRWQGGSARNDGTGGVANNTTQLAVRFRAGTGATAGAVTNLGVITATGAFLNGDGGDVRFEGSGAGMPFSGTLWNFGNNIGMLGNFQGV